MRTKSLLGRAGEHVAVAHLQRAGLQVLTRNWRPSGVGLRGEVDIIAREGPTLILCEVKSRRGTAAGGPLPAVTPRKLVQLRLLAAAYLAAANPPTTAVRIDVIAVTWPPGGGRPHLDHLRGVS
jgi:putative endonuclease